MSVRRFAAVLGVSPQRVSRLVAIGLPHTAPTRRGLAAQIDSVAAIAWLAQREVRKHAAPDGGTPRAEVARHHMVAMARIAEARADAAENRVVDRAAAMQLLHHLIDLCVQRMSVLPTALCDRLTLETEPSVIRDIVFNECRAVRQRLADDYAAMAEREAAGDA